MPFNLMVLATITILVNTALAGSPLAEDKKPGFTPLPLIESKRKISELERYKKSLLRGPVGRFQAMQVNPIEVLIIDTKEGHLWVWSRKKRKTTYQGQITPYMTTQKAILIEINNRRDSLTKEQLMALDELNRRFGIEIKKLDTNDIEDIGGKPMDLFDKIEKNTKGNK